MHEITTPFSSTLPCHVFPFVLRFEHPVPMSSMPIAPLRGLCRPALEHHHASFSGTDHAGARSLLVKPGNANGDHPQPFVFHCGPSRLLYTEDEGRNTPREPCEALHATIHAFMHDPGAIDVLLEALAHYGAAAARGDIQGGWPAGRGWAGFALARAPEHFTADPAPWSPHACEDDSTWGAWEVELITPWQQEIKVAPEKPQAPLKRMPLHQLFAPGPHPPCFYTGRPVTRHLLLHCLAMGSLRRLEHLAEATGSTCQIHRKAIAAVIWEQARVTRAAVTPRKYTYYRKTGQPIHLGGLVGRIEFEGPALLARILAAGSFTGIGNRPNYGCGRIDVRPL